MLVHAVATYAEKVGPVTPLPFLLPGGEQGVLLFFAISGFIIHNSSGSVSWGASSIGSFWMRRIIRIVPLYWLATIIYGAKLTLAGQPPGIEAWIKSLLFIPYGDSMMRPILRLGWTLNYEMLFYLIFSLSIALPAAFRLVAIAAVLFLLRIGHVTGFWTDAGLVEVQMLSEPFLDYFLIGMVLSALRKNFPGFQFISLSPLQACLWSVSIFTFGHTLGNHAGWAGHLFASSVTLCALFIALQECRDKANQSRTLRMITVAGDASFSTYLFHGFVMGPVARFISLASVPLSSALFGFLMVALCTWVGVFIYQCIEKPLLIKVSRRLNSNISAPNDMATR